MSRAGGVELQIAEQMARYYDDPLGFVMFAFPWGEPGTSLAHFPDGPDEWHRKMFLSLAEHVKKNIPLKLSGQHQIPWQSAVASGHGIGKSAMVAWLILWLMSTRIDCRGVVTANTAEQLQTKTWPELAKWHQLAIHKQWFKWTATQFYYALYPEDRRKNYCFDAITWSEERTEGFAGLHNAQSAAVMIFDEASAIPDKLREVASGAMTDGEPFLFAFGNPTRNQGWFFDAFNKYRTRWWTLNVDSREVRITNKAYLNELVETYGEDSDYVRVRIRGHFPSHGSAQFIPPEVVTAAVTRELFPDSGAPLLLGVDVARFGEDRTVLLLRQGRDARSFPLQKFNGLDTMQVAAQVVETINVWNPKKVFVDVGGPGAGVVDRIRQLGYKVFGVDFGSRPDDTRRYVNKRTEMWGKMREWLLEGGGIARDPELEIDLLGPNYAFSDKQQLKLERKEDMKKRGLSSPDIGDALALTFAASVARDDIQLARTGHGGRMSRDIDYDLFNP